MGATYQPPQWLVPNMGPGNVNKVGNYSFDFDNVDDYITMGNVDALNFERTDSFTFSFWFMHNVSPANTEVLLSKQDVAGGNYTGYNIWIDGTGSTAYIKFALAHDNSPANMIVLVGTTDMPPNVWRHCVITYDGSSTAAGVNIYLDNTPETLTTVSDTLSASTQSSAPFNIAARDNGSDEMGGKMSEILVFDYVLSTSERTELYGDATNGVGNPMGFASPPVAYYKADRAGFGDQWAVPNQVNYDQVFEFDGSSDYIDCGTSASIEITGDLTLSAWVYPTATVAAYRGIIVKEGNYRFYTDTSLPPALRFYDGSSAASSSGTLSSNTWNHVAISIDSGTGIGTFYINGSPSGTHAWTITSNTVDLDIGFGPLFFEGNISNCAVWDSALSAANITTLYNNGTPLKTLAEFPSSGNVQAWWKLDQSATWNGSNWSIPDDSTNSNTGTSLGSGMTQANLVPATLARSSSDSNYSFLFDGVGDDINMGNPANLQITGNLSISAWVKFDNATAPSDWFVSKDDNIGHPGRSYMLNRLNTGKIRFAIQQGGTLKNVQSSTVISSDIWYHVVGVNDGTDLKVYINGILDNTTAGDGGAIDNGTSDFTLGANDNASGYLTGNLSNVAVWNSTLTAANVITLYNNGRPGDLSSFSPTPVSWWKLGNDAFAEVGSPTAWTIPDQISTNDGTSQGNPTISGDAPGSTANGLSVSMDIEDRIGESGFSDLNAQSYNMATGARIAYT